MVLDPFAGSNTTGYVAEMNQRRWLSIEQNPTYAQQSQIRFRASFAANQDVRQAVGNVRVENERSGVITCTLDQTVNWWTRLWEVYGDDPNGCFADYRRQNDREWADDDLKALLVMLTRRRSAGGSPDCSGFRILRPLTDFHTSVEQDAFETDILTQLRAGRIVIVDLSIGSPEVQALFSERICRHVFNDAMQRFTRAAPNNFIQFYFEEAHNLFPKKDDKDLINNIQSPCQGRCEAPSWSYLCNAGSQLD